MPRLLICRNNEIASYAEKFSDPVGAVIGNMVSFSGCTVTGNREFVMICLPVFVWIKALFAKNRE